MSSLTRVGRELSEIVEILSRESSDSVVFISEKNNHFSVNAVCLLGQLVSAISKKEESTLAYFKKVFGSKRVERLQAHLDLSLIRDIKRSFIHLGEVTLADLEELFQEIKGVGSIRFLHEAESQALRQEFQQIAGIHVCSNAQIERLLSLLLPFASEADIFCKNVPKLTLPLYGVSQEKRVLMYERMRKAAPSEEMWIMNMAKILSDLEMPVGALVRGPKGNFCEVYEIIRGAGAYKYVLRTLGAIAATEGHYLLCRGTRPFPTCTDWWKTIVEDLRHHIGTAGSRATFRATQAVLQSAPFQGKKITAIGFSLGGVHAQYDAIFHTIHRVVTVASPGIDAASAHLFAKYANPQTVSIDHYVEAEDIVDQFGQKALGVGCDPKKTKVAYHIFRPGVRVSVDMKAELEKIGKERKALSKPVSDLLQFTLHVRTLIAVPKIIASLIQVMYNVHTRHTLCEESHYAILLDNQQHGALLEPILAHTSDLTNRHWEDLRAKVPQFLSKL